MQLKNEAYESGSMQSVALKDRKEGGGERGKGGEKGKGGGEEEEWGELFPECPSFSLEGIVPHLSLQHSPILGCG